MNICILFGAIIHLLAYTATTNGATIINIKYPQIKPTSSTFHIGSSSSGKYDSIRTTTTPAKRDLSLSYAATNIDSKEGTRVKTITVIKNVVNPRGSGGSSNKKPDKLAINPEDLHKNNEWASVFRDNFESFGGLPDVPDVEELFEFVNRKKPDEKEKKADEDEGERAKPAGKPKESSRKETVHKSMPELTTTITTETKVSADEGKEKGAESDEGPVEKIQGDAELLSHTNQRNILRLQAVSEGSSTSTHTSNSHAHKVVRTRESIFNVNQPLNAVNEYFEDYVQELPNGYEYKKPRPCPPNSIPVNTPSGKTYDIPLSNSSGTSGGNPYIAPAIGRKTQPAAAAQNNGTNNAQGSLQPNYNSVNSILPPLQQPEATQPLSQQQQPGNVQLPPQIIGIVPIQTIPALTLQPAQLGNPQQQSRPQVPQSQTNQQQSGASVSISTSQRPYVAPKLRNGLGRSRGPALPPSLTSPTQTLPIYRPSFATVAGPNYRPNIYAGIENRLNSGFRSRGLKY